MSNENGNVVTLGAGTLAPETLVRVARDPTVRVEVDPAALERVARCRGIVQSVVAEYEQAFRDHQQSPSPAARDKLAAVMVYGVTTGFGEFKTIALSPDELKVLSARILLSHSTGVGDSCDPDEPTNYYPAAVVRAALVLRLNTFLRGFSGVRPEIVHLIRDMLNGGVIPLVPTRGSVGSSGDLCPLAHLFVATALVGEWKCERAEEDAAFQPKRPEQADDPMIGRWYAVAGAKDVVRSRGTLQPASRLREHLATALRRQDYAIPYPREKEGLALTNGAAFSAAMLALAVVDAGQLALVADVAASMSLEAICGRTRALDPRVHEARGLRGQIDSAANMLKLLESDSTGGGKLLDRTVEVQDVYSVRCAPQVHGASRDATAYARMVLEKEITAATDNPLFFDGDLAPIDDRAWRARYGGSTRYHHEPRAYSAGNFHGEPVGMAADVLAIALAEFANISERRTQMLLDRHHNRGLLSCGSPEPGVNSGYMISQYCAAGLVSENKVLAHPATVDSIPTSASYEDHNAMASIAARKLLTVVGNVQNTLAIELMVVAQALDWRVHEYGRDKLLACVTPDERDELERTFAETADGNARDADRSPTILCQGTGAAFEAVRSVVPRLVTDRVLSEDVRAVRGLIVDGSLLAAVSKRVSGLRGVESLQYPSTSSA